MDSSELFQIHEFSTGIRYQATANSWVSLGFTGQYMNVTIPQIPYAVERSIANKEFAVAEGASSDEPAVIGRVVFDSKPWSVIAVVTRGRDEKGRSASLYRYFLCEGVDSLWKILTWIEDRRQNGQMSVFNPFDVKDVGQPNTWQLLSKPQVPLNLFEHLLKQPAPIIIPFGQPCTALIINEMANEMATRKADNQPVAWAFNVEALEQLRRFQIIYPASARASDLLQRAIASSAIVLAPVVADEQAIKSAIKGLINSSTVKPEYVQSLASSLANTQIPERYWREIFDGQGANNALKQGIYSPQMVRLMVLRAIAVPQTLPEHLTWLEKGNKQNDCHLVAAQFESQFRTLLDQIPSIKQNIELKISEGFQVVLSRLMEQKITPEAVNKLIESPNGLWIKFLRQFIKDIDYDLSLMRQSALGQSDLPFKLTDASWRSIWKELRVYWGHPPYPYKEKYQPLAKFFEQLEAAKLDIAKISAKISAFFYYVGYGQGTIPKKIFIQFGTDDKQINVYDLPLPIERQVTISEQFLFTFKQSWSIIVRLPIVLFLMLFSFVLGLALDEVLLSKIGKYDKPATKDGKVENPSKELPESNTSKPPFPESNESNASIPPQKSNENREGQSSIVRTPKTDEKLLKKFQKNREQIKKLIAELVKIFPNSGTYNEIEINLLMVINPDSKLNISMDAIKRDDYVDEEQIKNWVGAIGEYQQKSPSLRPVTQEIGSKTYLSLKCKIVLNLDRNKMPRECPKNP